MPTAARSSAGSRGRASASSAVFRRGRRLTAAIAALIALLFGGRWAAVVLTDRWWAQQISPAAVGFLTDWHVLRLILDLSGVLLASAWFIGHLLLVYRAVGSVQVRRQRRQPGVPRGAHPGRAARDRGRHRSAARPRDRHRHLGPLARGRAGVARRHLRRERAAAAARPRPLCGAAAGLAAGARLLPAARAPRARHRVRAVHAGGRGALDRRPARHQQPRQGRTSAGCWSASPSR